MSNEHDKATTDLDLEDLLSESRLTVIRIILAHPEEMPSIVEVDFWYEEPSRANIGGRLTAMAGSGILVMHEIDGDSNEFPSQFWTLSEDARSVLADANLLHIGNVLENLYDQVNKPNEVLLAENRPRPQIG